MKRFFSFLAAAAMLFAASCAEDTVGTDNGNEAQVTFNLGLEGQSGTRANATYGTGVTVTDLHYAVFDGDGNRIPTIAKKCVSDEFNSTDNTANVKLTLAKDQWYTVVFWAQHKDAAYEVSDNMVVTVKYVDANGNPIAGNLENRDAFYGRKRFQVKGSETFDNILLTRPFAQLNVGVTAEDYKAAKDSGVEITKSKAVVKGLRNTLDLLTGVATGDVDVEYTFAMANTPKSADEELRVKLNGADKTFEYLSMNYILVGTAEEGDDAKANITASFEFQNADDSKKIAFNTGLDVVPVERNHRTNIIGQILTGNLDFNVTIDADFSEENKDNHNVRLTANPSTEAELRMALENAAALGGTITLANDITLTKTIEVSATATLNLNGKKLINNNTSTGFGVGDAIVVKGAPVTRAAADYKEVTLTIEGEGTVESNFSAVWARGCNSKVIIKGGKFIGTKIHRPGTSVIYASASKDENSEYNGYGKVEIYGGEFIAEAEDASSFAEPQYAILNLHDGSGKDGVAAITVYGGKFHNFNPADNVSENPVTLGNFVAEGYSVTTEVDGTNTYYSVVKGNVVATSEELKAAFEKGGNIVLQNDIELDEVLNIQEGANVVLDMAGKTITLNGTGADPAFYTYKGSTLTIKGNGKVQINAPSVSLIFPGGDVVIENGTFIRTIPAGTPANQVGAFFVGAKVSPWGSQTVTIKGGYFDGGYYNADAADVDDILAGTKTLTETADDIAKRGNSKDANKVRVAIKQNVQLLLNLSYNLFKVYGGTFVGANPAWGDEGCMLPTTPNYLRPWSYYQGALLDGQTFNENGIVLPAGYEITKGATADGRPTYTVKYNK